MGTQVLMDESCLHRQEVKRMRQQQQQQQQQQQLK